MIKKAKLKAKAALKGNWFGAIVALVLFSLLSALLSMTGIGALFSGLLTFGYAAFCLELVKTKKAKIGAFFGGIFHKLVKRWLAGLLMGLYTFLWSLLFLIPGFIKYYAYSMTPYIMMEKPDMGINDAITKSREIMNGHKWQLFLLDLSFIGWMLLGVLTLGVAFIYVLPYYNAARAAFYKEIKGGAKPGEQSKEKPKEKPKAAK